MSEAEQKYIEVENELFNMILNGKWCSDEWDDVAECSVHLWSDLSREEKNAANRRGTIFWQTHPDLLGEMYILNSLSKHYELNPNYKG